MCPIPEKDDRYWGRQLGGKQPTAQTPQPGKDCRGESQLDFHFLCFFQKKVKLGTKTLNSFQRPMLKCQLLENENENETKTVVKIS